MTKITIFILSGGGAGIGRPEHRDPNAVRVDVRNELVSVEMARDVYKVVTDPETFEIDQAATESLRQKTYRFEFSVTL